MFQLTRKLKSALLIAISGLSLSTFASAETNNDKENQIISLQNDVELLKKQVAILNRNQQALGKHVGISKRTQQPSLDIQGSATLGDKAAKVILIEFTDLHCPFCKRFHQETFPELKKTFIEKGELLFVGKHYPIVGLHPNALVAAQSLECARTQEPTKYSAAKDWLFEKGGKYSDKDFPAFTNEVGLNISDFKSCLASSKIKQRIDSDIEQVRSLNLNQTPAFILGLHNNGEVTEWRKFVGAKNFEQLNKVIKEFIEKANK